MNVLVINAGSSSLKYQLIDMRNEAVLAKGNCERIGIGGFITHKPADGRTFSTECDFPTHKEAFEKLVDLLVNGEYAVIKSLNEIAAVGHRIVQGAEHFTKSELVTEEILKTIEDIAELAPLHNPAHVLGIKACLAVFPSTVPQVVVFDTSFHQTMPKKAYMFGVPYKYYKKYHVRRYGFHGTSHRFVSNRLAKILKKDINELKIITCHLGNGSSIAAVNGGKCVDTSMGFTPLDGLVMGTRSGNVDASVVLYIMQQENFTPERMNNLLNKESGYLGLTELTSDFRDLRQAASDGNDKAQLALDMMDYQIKKYIGSYTAVMGGLDAIVFTGGIGENSVDLRRNVCENMEYFGISIDKEKNDICNGKEAIISTPDSKVAVYIVPTNEELLIARDTVEIING